MLVIAVFVSKSEPDGKCAKTEGWYVKGGKAAAFFDKLACLGFYKNGGIIYT